tara:strand:+ start:898 stop:1740 length:843 start_codon:yes stop_codon:yes gene_type:complete
MGRGIVHVALASGFQVRLSDISEEAVANAVAGVHKTLGRAVERGKLSEDECQSCHSNLQTSVDAAEAASGADLVIEAIPESIDLKCALYARIAPVLGAQTILATNTSALPVTQLAEASGVAERFVGMHFFNPPFALKLLELIRTEHSSEDTLSRARVFAAQLGRQLVEVRDSPGFATSRLGITLANEAMRMVEQEVASASDIDTALRFGYGHPMGPLELTDLVGLDVRLAITRHLYAELGTDTFQPPRILEDLVSQGRLGRKSGHGFYHWVDGKKVETAS